MAVIALAFGVVAGLTGGIAQAADNQGTHICLESSTNSCLNLPGDKFVEDNYLIIFGAGAIGLGWQINQTGTVCSGGTCGAIWPFPSGSGLNTKYNGRPVYTIKKTQGSGTNGCLGEVSAPGPSFAAAWEPCSSSKADLWVYSADQYLVSVNISSMSTNGAVYFASSLAAAATGNNASVIVAPEVDPFWPYVRWVFR
jgi:hypothetical protein